MSKVKKTIGFVVLFVGLVLIISSCDILLGSDDEEDVVFQSVVETGGTSGTADSTGLTLTFDIDPTTLAASDITLTGASKGDLSGTGTTRSLAISDITVANGETVTVAIANPSGFTISGSPRTAVVYRAPVVLFQSVVETGGTSETTDSTGLTLTFDVDPTTLAASDITVTGATKGDLSGSGTTRSLDISDITVGNGETVSVAIANPSGFTISGSPRTAVVYRAPYIGMPYHGGIIAYIFQSGDPGYVSGETHGLIAATTDQDDGTGIIWAVPDFDMTLVGGTGTVLGTGSGNTDNIIDQNGAGITYAAGLARAHDGGGYDDWYLPSKDELNKLYLNKDAVGGFGGGYWSSSEDSNAFALYQHFHDGIQGDFGAKDSKYNVRAVRAF